MTLLVVDSSVVIKWFTPEALSPEANRVRTGSDPLHAPEFLDVEVAAIAWKKVRRGVLSRADADFILAQLPVLPITRHPIRPLVPQSFDLADQNGRTVYDCLYLALAVQLGGVMVTADDKFVAALVGSPWAASVLRLAEVP
jgi:predicted nucleic acid-binding protein